MSKRKRTLTHRATRVEELEVQRSTLPSAENAAESPTRVLTIPVWDEDVGKLYWAGVAVLRLASHAHTERAILNELTRKNWNWIVFDPFSRDSIGDPTQVRRNAIRNLNRRQGNKGKKTVHFFAISGGFIGWCPANWLATN